MTSLFCVISPNSVDSEATYVKVDEVRLILSAIKSSPKCSFGHMTHGDITNNNKRKILTRTQSSISWRRGQSPDGRTEYVNCQWAGLWGETWGGAWNCI